MRYIITGHKGLIGREIKKLLDSHGHECVMAIDLKNGNDMSQIFAKGVTADIFLHLASFCKIRQTIMNPELSNIDATSTFRALEFCRINKIPRFVYFSSVRTLADNHTPYTAAKKYGEELVKAYHECYRIQYLIIRPSTVYGGIDETGRLMSIWISNALQNKDLIIYGDKNKTLNFTFITDFLEGFIDALKGEWNKDINICGDTVKLEKVAKEIIKYTKSKSKIKFMPPEIGQPQKMMLKPTNNKVSIEDGIKQYVDSFVKRLEELKKAQQKISKNEKQ